MKAKTKTNKDTIVGIIMIGMGSTWLTGTDEVKVSVECAKMCKSDWKHMFKFKKDHVFPVNLYDIKDCEDGWFATFNGVFVVRQITDVNSLKQFMSLNKKGE